MSTVMIKDHLSIYHLSCLQTQQDHMNHGGREIVSIHNGPGGEGAALLPTTFEPPAAGVLH